MMKYVGIYLLIGMLYAGLTIKSTVNYFAGKGFKEAINKKYEDMSTDEQALIITVALFTIIASVLKVLFYPFVIAVSSLKLFKRN